MPKPPRLRCIHVTVGLVLLLINIQMVYFNLALSNPPNRNEEMHPVASRAFVSLTVELQL